MHKIRIWSALKLDDHLAHEGCAARHHDLGSQQKAASAGGDGGKPKDVLIRRVMFEIKIVYYRLAENYLTLKLATQFT